MSSLTESLRTRVLRPVVEDRRASRALGVVAFALMTAISAQVAVVLPWTPVPVTLQPLFVVLAGVLLGARAGALAMAAYVTVGALGAPVFSNGGAGLPWLLGPTGGYLLAAPAAAFVAGAVAGRARGASGTATLRLLAGLTLGIATMYAGGVLQLAGLTGRGLGEAAALGVLPFVVGDLTKIAFAFFAVLSVRGLRGGAE
jgi:biotin transport system substrate-specific component